VNFHLRFRRTIDEKTNNPMDVIYRYDPYAPIEPRVVPDAAAACQRLIEGNEHFVDRVSRMQLQMLGGESSDPIIVPVSPVTMGLPLYPGAIPTQAPFAAVMGCADARVPIEQVFDQAFNDLFVLRVAGNVLSSEGLGSLHYCLSSFAQSLKVVVVLGHSKCGAVTAAADSYLHPDFYLDMATTHALRSIVDQLQISVRAASLANQGTDPSLSCELDERSRLTAVAVYTNAALTALSLQREIRSYGVHSPPVVFGVYDFDSLRVQTLPGAEQSGLRPAPTSAEEMTTYANEVAHALLDQNAERQGSSQMTMHW
jgi:carbonic anhydrase